MATTPKLDSLTASRKELTTVRRLLRDTKQQIDDATEQGNMALLDLQEEFNELAEKKRQLLREIEKLEEKRDNLLGKTKAAESIYGEYLKAIKEKRASDIV